MIVSVHYFKRYRFSVEADNSMVDLQVLFEPKQWDYLVEQFKQEFCKLYGMTLEPLLNIYLQAGLSALKTPYPSHSTHYLRYCPILTISLFGYFLFQIFVL